MSTPGSIKFKQKYSFFKLLAYYTRSKKNKKKSELLSLLCILILGLSPFQLMSLSTIKMVKSDPKLIILSLLPILRLNLWDTLHFVFFKAATAAAAGYSSQVDPEKTKNEFRKK